MTDLTSAQWQELLDTNKQQAGYLAKLVGAGNSTGNSGTGRAGAARRLTGDLTSHKIDRAIDKTATHLTSLAGGFDELFRHMKGILAGVVGGSVISDLLDTSNGMTRTFRQMTDVGQTFGGSMLEMSKQAAQAGVPLEDFAKMLEKNSVIAAAMATSTSRGGQSFGQLTLAVRNSMRQFGFYGMTIEEISDLTGDYAETMREQSQASMLLDKNGTRNAIQDFGKEITEFASITGKSRREIIKLTQEAVRDVGVSSRFAAMGINAASEQQRKALLKGTAFGAAMPGESGEMLSKFIAQTFGAGSSQFVPEIRDMFAHAMIPEGISILDQFNSRIQSGTVTDNDESTMLESFQRLYHQNADMLNYSATIGHNADAAAAIRFFRGLEGLNPREQLAKIKQQQKELAANERFTNTMLTLEDTFHKISAWFREGFLAGLEPLERSFAAIDFDGPTQFQDNLFALGKSIGTFISKVLSPDNIAKMSATLTHVADVVLPTMSAAFNSLSGIFMGLNADEMKNDTKGFVATFHRLGGIFGMFLTVMESITGAIKSVFTKLEDLFTPILGKTGGTDAAAIGTVGGGVALYALIKTFLNRSFNTATFYIKNGMFPGGGGPGGTGKGGFLGKAGKFLGLATGAAMVTGLVMELLPDFKGKETATTILDTITTVGFLGSVFTGLSSIVVTAGTTIASVFAEGGLLARLTAGLLSMLPASVPAAGSGLLAGGITLAAEIATTLAAGAVAAMGGLVIHEAMKDHDIGLSPGWTTGVDRDSALPAHPVDDASTLSVDELSARNADLMDNINQRQTVLASPDADPNSPQVVNLLTQLNALIEQQTEVQVLLNKQQSYSDRRNKQNIVDAIINGN